MRESNNVQRQNFGKIRQYRLAACYTEWDQGFDYSLPLKRGGICPSSQGRSDDAIRLVLSGVSNCTVLAMIGTIAVKGTHLQHAPLALHAHNTALGASLDVTEGALVMLGNFTMGISTKVVGPSALPSPPQPGKVGSQTMHPC